MNLKCTFLGHKWQDPIVLVGSTEDWMGKSPDHISFREQVKCKRCNLIMPTEQLAKIQSDLLKKWPRKYIVMER